MRIVSKGGVWKNTEDEILKAAVMKYGKNQWARISSLLVRKSAKQCKTRWYEWLDPSIKKTEWSREEEEKLLHLAKIMPNQWRTIAPIVGRTASQCLEHYEKLLDSATARDESYDPSEDPRRLRPGEIDPNPESKPARPDPIDMDEDEKEMLSEARARLANTKGKKAKRKAREKQLEEARRLAALQKRRELKAAGIELPKPRKKMKGMDYNKEIPFQKLPPPGFYETEAPKQNAEPFKPISIEKLEGKRRRDEEDEAREQDSKKQKKKADQNLPQYIMQVNKLNEPEQLVQRSKLILPKPQLDENDLEQIQKLKSEQEIEYEGSSVTKGLLPDFRATPLPSQTPMRTPLPARTPSREDIIMKEAQNLVALTTSQTPLFGGENPQLHPSDFSGITPRTQEIRTPNILAPTNRSQKTPALLSLSQTPIRDELRLNKEEQLLLDKKKQIDLRNQLKEGFKALPKPQNEYNIELPELPEEIEEETEKLKPDASDLLLETQKKQEEEENQRRQLQSDALKKDLPRPNSIPKEFLNFHSTHSEPTLKQAEEMIRKEMIDLISYEAMAYPYKNCRIKEGNPNYSQFTVGGLKEAKNLIIDEIKKNPPNYSPEDLEQYYINSNPEFWFVPSLNKYVLSSSLSQKEKLEALQTAFEKLKSEMTQEAAKAKKVENKLNIYNGGYQNRANLLLNQIQALTAELQQANSELDCFSALQELETQAIPKRLESLRQLVQVYQQKEASNQQRYKELLLK